MAIIRTRRIIDDAGAAAVHAAAERAANEQGHRVVIAVVDPWGELVHLRRTAGAQAASSRVAVDKARTAAIFVRPSREMEEQVTNGRIGALALHGASALPGGIPLVVEELEVQRHFDINEFTDTHHDYATIPHTLILSPGLVIEKVYVGYWFWGRPSNEQLWADIGELLMRIKPDFDLQPAAA